MLSHNGSFHIVLLSHSTLQTFELYFLTYDVSRGLNRSDLKSNGEETRFGNGYSIEGGVCAESLLRKHLIDW